MGKLILKLIVIVSFFYISNGSAVSQNRIDYKMLKDGFSNPAGSARPKVYWWCLNGNIDTISARKEFLEMKKAGIGGFDFFEIGVPKQDTMIQAGPAFLSDESLKVIKFAVREAGKLDLEMGLNLSSSWNAGGSWTLSKNTGKSLYYSNITIKGGIDVQKIKIPFPDITSFQHWQEGPADIRPMGDRAFCEGMSRVVFHGFSHNPVGTGFPGIVYGAGTH